MKKHPMLWTVLLAVLLSATPVFAATQLTRYHTNANFNSVVGARFEVWWPCETDWSSWGTTSNYAEVIDNWDDCEQGVQSRSCWIYDCGVWVQVTCPA